MFKRTSILLLALGACALTALGQQPAPSPAPQQPPPLSTHLKVGQQAPDFALTDTQGKEVKLSDFKGTKNVVLAFYVLAFTGG
jgi:cytochrome oxidase Cu insertion factor (SCO1/SenC/PrrC family)